MIIKRIRKGRKQMRASEDIGLITTATIAYLVNAGLKEIGPLQTIERLTGYVLGDLHPERGSMAGEKVRECGQYNLDGANFVDWQADMAAVAMGGRGADPLEHFVMSWHQDEVPTAAQVIAAVDILLKALDADGLQVVWAVHDNTRFIHVHIVINRVCPLTHKRRELGSGWDIDRLHQTAALIESRQGWRSEVGGLYKVDQLGTLRDRSGRPAPAKGVSCRGQRAADQLAAQSKPAVFALASAIASAAGWSSLHRNLGQLDAVYQLKGSGAEIIVAGRAMKASAVSAACSLKAVEKRFGSRFRPGPTAAEADPHRLQILQTIAARLTELSEARQVTRRLITRQREATIAAMVAQTPDPLLQAVLNRAITAESDISWRLAANDFNAEATRLRAARQQVSTPGSTDEMPLFFLSPEPELAAAVPVPGYTAERGDRHISYRRPDGFLAFTDRITYVAARSTGSDADLVAAMRLAEARFGCIAIGGSPSNRQRSLLLAQTHQIAARVATSSDIDTPKVEVAQGPITTVPAISPGALASDGVGPHAVDEAEIAKLRTIMAEAQLEAAVLFHSKLKLLKIKAAASTPEFERVRGLLAPFLTADAKAAATGILAAREAELRDLAAAELQITRAAGKRRQIRISLDDASRSAGILKAKRVAAAARMIRPTPVIDGPRTVDLAPARPAVVETFVRRDRGMGR